MMIESIVHERMLVGAIDSFLGSVVHVRPHLAADYREQLERVAERWIAGGGQNELERVHHDWLEFYLKTVEDPATAEIALRDFYRWALRENLIDCTPIRLI